MQIVVDTEAVAAALGSIAGAAGAATVIFLRVIRPARRLMVDWRLFREDWFGEPGRPGVDERPGMMVRMRNVEAEFRPNGGTSMRDRVNLIERRQIAHESSHAAASAAVATMSRVSENNHGEAAA